MMKTRVNGTERPEMDAGLRRGIAAAAVLLIVCVLAVGAVSAADMVTVSSIDGLESNIDSASGDLTIIVSASFPITRQLIIDSGNITLTTDGTDHTLSRGNSFTDNLFIVNSGGNLTITGNPTQTTNLTLDGMDQDSDSLVKVNGGNFTLADGGILTNNTAYSGGGVYVYNSGTFTMSGGEISGNTANNGYGGGVYVNSGTFTMSGGEISGNTASNYGGGVYVDNSGTFTMSGGTISSNTASYGGGVCMFGTFEMSGNAAISDNTADGGGGVCVYMSGTFEMSGNAAISDNTADGGGGVYMSGTFEMSGNAAISDNTAGSGGGVYVESGTFELSGSGSTDSVYLSENRVITVTGALDGPTPQIRGIELAKLDDGTEVVTFSGVSGKDYLSRFTLDPSVNGFKLEYQSPDSIVLKLLPYCQVTFDANGGNPTSTMPFTRGEPISPPANLPTRDGYTLTGWYTEDTCQNLWDFTTQVDEDLILYAGWKKDEPQPSPSYSSGDGNMENAYRVLFNDGATTLSVQTDLSSGDKLTKPEDPVKDGYTFAGWYKDSACTNPWDFETGIPGDMTLYAKWTAIEATTAPTATSTAVTTPQPTKTQTAAATTSAPEATTAAGVSPTLTQAPAPVAGALFGLLAAGVLLRRRFQ